VRLQIYDLVVELTQGEHASRVSFEKEIYDLAGRTYSASVCESGFF